jgi:hypothetical protein
MIACHRGHKPVYYIDNVDGCPACALAKEVRMKNYKLKKRGKAIQFEQKRARKYIDWYNDAQRRADHFRKMSGDASVRFVQSMIECGIPESKAINIASIAALTEYNEGAKKNKKSGRNIHIDTA